MAKYAMITGASSGIGKATASALAKKGYDLVIASRSLEKLEAVKKEVEAAEHVTVTPVVLDVTDLAGVHQTTSVVLEKFGAPDVLVNDAGLARGLEPYAESDEEDILEMIDTNIKGLFIVTHDFLPAMVKRNSGHIVNLGSTAGLYAYAGAAVYCASKAAVKTFSDGIRIDLMPTDVKVTTIQPGMVETPFSEVRFHGDKERAANVYKGIEALTPEDIADTIAYVVDTPRRMQISDVVILANQQGTGFLAHKE